ncbi:hypothetical protein VC83_05665 [Pseudogymnoascus destructans]|uniref:Phosducin domain-containing protein n=1 Tax=Pseudogymnoascus destructans TaxID=655981 RepID=A0A177A7X5_9PEZI|nr:uncharacterized protein VC83_05665 [Pseudogymnoascus destructans]OAF57820.1 hypothetical protein VC83_05665 [Pseudogymnoascus destructans]
MTAQTPAQEEFQAMLDKAWFGGAPSDRHPEDANGGADEIDEADEEARHREQQMEEAMRAPSGGRGGRLNLPPPSFDSGRTTGVKGVIADARSFEQARREGLGRVEGAGGEEALEEDEEFLEKWREERRRELERDGSDIRNRRTSPSVRRFGRFDEVDALGYLDAIEKVGWETVVVVFVYDIECAVSQVIEEALTPLVATHPEIHFVKVHYDDIEFDNAGVPAMLAYKQQGELFANLTYIIDQIPEDTNFDTQALKNVLRKHKVL